MSDRPAGRLRMLLSAYPRISGAIAVVLLLLVAANVVAAVRLVGLRNEVARLRGEMSDGERNRTDLALRSEENRTKVMMELIRRQAKSDRELHLTVQIDSNRMFLERDGVVLREIPVVLGRSGLIGQAPDTHKVTVKRGASAVATAVGANDPWEVPGWVLADRSISIPAPERKIRGALGRSAFVLSDGTIIYSMPAAGPLADSSYVLPGAILLRGDDMRAIAANITPGLTVYLYE